jgi:hypothetical protein
MLPLVDRPGPDPGTLGLDPGDTVATVVVRASWLEDRTSVLTSVDVLSNVVPWLHDWLHGIDGGASFEIEIICTDGTKIMVHVSGQSL